MSTEKLTLMNGPMAGKMLIELCVRQEVFFRGVESGHTVVIAVADAGDKALLMEEGRKYFVGLYMDRGWASPQVWVVQFNGSNWDVLERVEITKGKRRKSLFAALRTKHSI